MTNRDTFGVYRATVKSNSDPLVQGRLQVVIPALSGTSVTGWIEPCITPGATLLPEINDVVWVMCEQGSPDHLLWIGTLAYNPGPPDMIIDDLGLPVGFVAGQSIQFLALVKNQGIGPTPKPTVGGGIITRVLFLVDGEQVSISDNYSAVITPGEIVEVAADEGWVATVGSHTLTATVNPGGLPSSYAESDATNNSASVTFTIGAAPSTTGSGAITWVTTTDPPAGDLNTAYTTTFIATNATKYVIASGEIPQGLSLSSSTGVLAGTPSTGGTDYDFSITASNSANSSTQGPFTLSISTPYTYGPGGTYSTWYFPNATCSSLQLIMTPVQDAPPSLTGSAPGQPFVGFLHNYAMTFNVLNSTTAQGGGYAAFQTNGIFGGDSQGKVINFSLWGSTNGTSTNPNTLINAQNVESGGYQMMLRYNWQVGHSYLFNIALGPDGVISAGTWWGLTVTDQTTSVATYVGQQLIPNVINGQPSTVLNCSISTFGEDLHAWQSETGNTIYASPTAFQNSAMAFSGATADGTVAANAISGYTNTGASFTGSNGYKTTNAKVTEYINKTTFAAQHNLGYWVTTPPNTVSGTLIF